MKKINILAVCSHPEILQTIIRLVNNNPEWDCTGADSEQQVINLFKQQSFDLVLLGSGMDQKTEDKLKPLLMACNAGIKFIQHYGGGSGLLSAEIYEALAR